MSTINFQLCQTFARDPSSKDVQPHAVPPLTYVAPAFYTMAERKIRNQMKEGKGLSKTLSFSV